jgi:cytochrome c5
LNRDQKFFDIYSLVLGVLAIFALGIYVLVDKMSDMTQGIYTSDTAEFQAAVQARIQPLGQVYLPGEEKSAGHPQVEEAAPAEPVATVLSGPQVFNEACLMCHGSGIGGAPTLDDTESWAPRIAQGKDTLYQHAIEGFSGQLGFMPPKGARMDLSDDEVRRAVDYMVNEPSN